MDVCFLYQREQPLLNLPQRLMAPPFLLLMTEVLTPFLIAIVQQVHFLHATNHRIIIILMSLKSIKTIWIIFLSLSMLENTNNVGIKEDSILYKYLIVSVISIFESFIRDLIVSRVASCEDSFNNYYSKIYNSLSDKRKEQFDRMTRGELERKIILMLYEESFSNASKINNSFKEVYNFPDCVCSGTNIGKFIKMRHQIAHKNARKEDGTL